MEVTYKKYASVLLDLGLKTSFTYGIQDQDIQILEKGMCVKVPLRGVLQTGIILDFANDCPFPKVLPIHSIVSKETLMTPELFKLAEWISSYYLTPIAKTLKLFFPKSMAVIRSALAQYDFTPFKTIYDIGGGYGHFMQALLSHCSHLQGALFELPEVITSIKEQNPGWENNRCELISGDFFKSLPKEGDLYLLKSVLHDWDDKQCKQILTNCHQAMDSHSRLLIIEVVLKPKDESIYANCMDVLMLAVTGGKERSLNDFEQMLDKTGFVIERVYPTSTEFSILEVKKK